jgi:putative transposase
MLPQMYLTPYSTLTWAYQLHYYLCFRTHRRKLLLASDSVLVALHQLILEISGNHDFSLLENKIYPNQLRCLFSLQPSQTIAKTIQILKSNSARELAKAFELPIPLWARGYMSRSAGHVRTSCVRNYLESQAEHHGYANRILPPVFKYRAVSPVMLSAAHASFDLSHHLVFSTKRRKGVFTAATGEELTRYWLGVAAKREFALDQISIVPDHLHLIVRIVPKMSIETVALLLMNNGQYFIGQHYPELLIENGIDQLWNASAYAGTCGDITTALIMKWLESDE